MQIGLNTKALFQTTRLRGLAVLLVLILASHAYAQMGENYRSPNAPPEMYLALSAHVNTKSNNPVEAEFWSLSCVNKECRRKGIVDSETQLMSAEGESVSLGKLKAHKKYRVGSVSCKAAGCSRIAVIQLLD